MRALRLLCVGAIALLACGFTEVKYNVARELRPVKVITDGEYLLGGPYAVTRDDKKVPVPVEIGYDEKAGLYTLTMVRSDGSRVPVFGIRTYKLDGLPANVYLMQLMMARVDDLPVVYNYGFLRVRKGGVDGFMGGEDTAKMAPEIKAMRSEKGQGLKNPERDLLAYMRAVWFLDNDQEKRMYMAPADLQPEKKE